MIWTSDIFSSNALYLYNAPLDIRGKADADTLLTVTIQKNGEIFSSVNCTAGSDGRFIASFDRTPDASFDNYEIVISSKNEQKILSNILFGELWLACGQSNMEMANIQQPEWATVSQRIKNKPLRFFTQPRLPHDAQFPFEPDDQTEGFWITSDEEKSSIVSALATVFSEELYEHFKSQGKDCPVGFLNCCRGGTRIETWIPKDKFESTPAIAHKKPSLEGWNEKGEGNYQQSAAHFNRHTASHIGVRARGMLWYQGESNMGEEQTNHIYKDYLTALRDSYKDLFSPSKDDIFPIVSSHIYPWRYSYYSDTFVGYINQSFTDLAKKDPLVYPFVPVCDLTPIWNYCSGNHPIHPAHKYALGQRFALLVKNLYYGRTVKNLQKRPATLKSCVRHGNKLRLTFDDVGSGLFIEGKNIRGMYVRSKKGVYTPAICEIVSKNVLNVYHPYIEFPVHAAYAVASFEPETNLFAGEFPVAPFCTEFTDKDNSVSISYKPWLNNELDSTWIFNISEGHLNVFNNAIFNPLNDSSVCFDRTFSLSGRSVRINANDNKAKEFGAYLNATQFTTLDLQNYKAIKLMIYNAHNTTMKLKLHYQETNGTALMHTLSSTKNENESFGWAEYTVDLTSIPQGTITKADFIFSIEPQKLNFVNIDNIMLIPQQ